MSRAEYYLSEQLRRCQEVVGLTDWQVATEKVSRLQVIGPNGRPGYGLIGIRPDGNPNEKKAILFYTSESLSPEDIFHELLHIVHSDWPHQKVLDEAKRLAQLTDFSAGKNYGVGEVAAGTDFIRTIDVKGG